MKVAPRAVCSPQIWSVFQPKTVPALIDICTAPLRVTRAECKDSLSPSVWSYELPVLVKVKWKADFL